MFITDLIRRWNIKETTFEVDTLTGKTKEDDGTETSISIDWDAKTVAEKENIVAGLIDNTIEVEQLVTIKTYKNVVYTASGQMASYDLTTDTRGYTLNKFDEAEQMAELLETQSSVITEQSKNCSRARRCS